MIDYSIVGKRFGKLVVLDLDHVSEKHHGTWWRCRCDCGKEVVVYRGGLTSGDNIYYSTLSKSATNVEDNKTGRVSDDV